jgi:predicted nucleotidyltransferase component of viral defense system
MIYNSLQLREIFHLEFLRRLGRKIKPKYYAVKGGANLRFFFQSFRYSEDMDLDISDVEVIVLKDIVMKILQSPSFQNGLKPFGVERIVSPDIARAKQTETTQRFKTHLVTPAGEDLFTKVEFSRRGFKGRVIVQAVSNTILRAYKLPPLLIAHYDIQSAIIQKIKALATRSAIQARDIFDLYILSSQFDSREAEKIKISDTQITKAYENVFEVSFEQFRDTVIFYLSPEDKALHNSSSLWDEIKLKTANFIDELGRQYA